MGRHAQSPSDVPDFLWPEHFGRSLKDSTAKAEPATKRKLTAWRVVAQLTLLWAMIVLTIWVGTLSYRLVSWTLDHWLR